MDSALVLDQETRLTYTLLRPQDALAPESAGPTRESATVLCFHGSGNEDHAECWLPLIKEISRLTPVLFYIRRGYGHERSHEQTPEEAAQDLVALLKSQQLQSPYILVAHSYGGAIAREFLQDQKRHVVSMVLAETGLETPIKHEQEQYRTQILGSQPLSVIHANLGRFFGSAQTAEQKKIAEMYTKEDERLKKAQLQLSSNHRYVRVADCGHHVVRDRPDIVAQEVGWVINNYTAVSQSSIGDRFMQIVQRLVRLCRFGRNGDGEHKT